MVVWGRPSGLDVKYSGAVWSWSLGSQDAPQGFGCGPPVVAFKGRVHGGSRHPSEPRRASRWPCGAWSPPERRSQSTAGLNPGNNPYGGS